jgi:hypothetical protein
MSRQLPDENVFGDDVSSKDDSSVKLESGDEVNGSPEFDPPSVIHPSLIGALCINGPHLNSPNEDIDSQTSTEDPNEPLPNAEPVDELPTAHAEPVALLVPFYVKHRRLLTVTACTTIVVTVVVIISFILSIYMRNNRLKAIVCDVSNQASIKGLGLPQTSAMKWILGPNNINFDPKKKREQIAQRYQMATVYYSMQGENWSDKGKFLSPDDECMFR